MASFTFFLGLGMGSFLNVVIARLPKGENFVKGRSKCPACGHILAWSDLFPLASFIFLKRKCRYCLKKISGRYFLVELLTGLIFLAFFWITQSSGQFSLGPFLFWLAVILLLIALAFIDFDYFIIPDKILIVLLLLGFLYQLFGQSILANFMTAVITGMIFFMIFVATKGEKMGLGDVKLIALLGFIFGFPGILLIFYLAAAGALVWSVILILWFGGKLHTKIPFGSLLSGSAIAFILFNKLLLSFFMPYILKLYV